MWTVILDKQKMMRESFSFSEVSDDRKFLFIEVLQ